MGRRGPARKSLEQAVQDGLRPDSGGSELQRVYADLKNLTSNAVLRKENAHNVFVSMKLLWRHIADVTPFKQTVLFLCAYVIARQCCRGKNLRQPTGFIGGTITVQEYLAIMDAYNPASGYKLKDVIPHLHLHPVYKDQGDDRFFNDGKKWWLLHAPLATTLHLRCVLLLTALFFLSVRSESVLAFLLSNPDCLLHGFDDFGTIWKGVVQQGTVFIGLKASKRAKRNQHTTEQKTWSVGMSYSSG
jgi:hypothetical protein